MRISSHRSRMIAGGLAASLALGSAAPGIAAPVLSSTSVLRAAAAGDVARIRWRGIHVPAGILARVASGASPGGVPTQTYYPPYFSGLDADPHYWPPPVVVAPPLLHGVEAIELPFDGDCFVPLDHAGQHGYYRQWINRPD